MDVGKVVIAILLFSALVLAFFGQYAINSYTELNHKLRNEHAK